MLVCLCVLCQQVRWTMLLVHMSVFYVNRSLVSVAGSSQWLVLLVHLSVFYGNRSGG